MKINHTVLVAVMMDFPPVLCVAIQCTLLKPTLGVLTLLWGILSQLTGAFAKKETMEDAENK